MRAKEFITEVVNKELWHPERMFKQRVPIGDYEFEARESIGGMGDYDADALTIIAYDPKKKNKVIGNADFVVKGRGSKRSLVSDDTYVDPKYRGEGIATMMYAYAKSLGNDIKGSNIQTPMGKQMWANWGSDAKHLRGVAEGSLEELANTSLKVKEPKDFVNTNDRKQVTYKVMKFKSGKDTYLINFTVKGAPAFGKKQNWNAVNVAFGVKEKQDDYSFGDEINTDLTARNKNQFLIYSTVINAIRKFITEYNTEIDEIIMQGAGERQEAMYQRFFQSAGKYFPGWHYDGKHSLVRDVPRQKVKKVREQGVAEDAQLPGDFKLMGQNLFLKNLARNLKQRYPDATVKLSSDRVTAYHNEGDDEALTVMGTEVMDSGYIGVGLDDAFTESFQGVLVPTIKQTTEQLLAANPGTRPALFLSTDNWNPDAWTHIATKLGYRLVADDESLDEQYVAEGITPKDIHKLADRKNVKWDNEPSFLKLTKQLTGKEHLDDLNQAGLNKVKQHLEKQGTQ